jgi:hypothetical protein
MEFRKLMDTGNLHLSDREPSVHEQAARMVLSSRRPEYPGETKAKIEKMHAPPGVAHEKQRKYMGVQRGVGGVLITTINDAPLFRHNELSLNQQHEGLERMKQSRVTGGGSPFSTNTRAQLLATRRYGERIREHGALLNTGIGAHQTSFYPNKRNNAYTTRSEMLASRRKDNAHQNAGADRAIDFDGDGNIDADEVMLSSILDKNHDGLVTKQEIKDWVDKEHAAQAEAHARIGKNITTIIDDNTNRGEIDSDGHRKVAAVDVMMSKLSQNYRRKKDRPLFPMPKDVTGDPKRIQAPTETEYHDGIYVDKPVYRTRSELLDARARQRVSRWGYHGEAKTILTDVRGRKPNEIRGERAGIKPKQIFPESPHRRGLNNPLKAHQCAPVVPKFAPPRETQKNGSTTGAVGGAVRGSGREENVTASGAANPHMANYNRLLDIDRRLQYDRKVRDEAPDLDALLDAEDDPHLGTGEDEARVHHVHAVETAAREEEDRAENNVASIYGEENTMQNHSKFEAAMAEREGQESMLPQHMEAAEPKQRQQRGSGSRSPRPPSTQPQQRCPGSRSPRASISRSPRPPSTPSRLPSRAPAPGTGGAPVQGRVRKVLTGGAVNGAGKY